MSIYASDPDAPPDSDYEPGALRHLAAGARGRMLDARRTPVSVVEVQPEVGFVRIRVEAFEDAGTIWQVPLEQANHYQFEPDGPHATESDVVEMEAAIGRLAHDQVIEADEVERVRTETRIAERQAKAATWMAQHSRFLAEGRSLPDPSTRQGDHSLAADLEAFMRDRGLQDVEEAFARGYVSNPGSGEIVKGHRIVLAELGLARYAGPIVRDPATFSGGWTRERRADHISERLAFVRALFERMGMGHVTLWRGFSTESGFRRRDGRSFVSTSFSEAVARSHFEGGPPSAVHGLAQRDVPVGRLFMTYLETAAMNTIFLEAEAVLLDHPDERWP